MATAHEKVQILYSYAAFKSSVLAKMQLPVTSLNLNSNPALSIYSGRKVTELLAISWS